MQAPNPHALAWLEKHYDEVFLMETRDGGRYGYLNYSILHSTIPSHRDSGVWRAYAYGSDYRRPMYETIIEEKHCDYDDWGDEFLFCTCYEGCPNQRYSLPLTEDELDQYVETGMSPLSPLLWIHQHDDWFRDRLDQVNEEMAQRRHDQAVAEILAKEPTRLDKTVFRT